MKTTGFLCCLFACLQIGAQGQTRVIEQPAFDTWNSTTLEIDRIELSDTATVFYVDAFSVRIIGFKSSRKLRCRPTGKAIRFALPRASR